MQLNHIELFAGCGGLSLGLDRAGFELVFANELSPMAAETFSFNFLGEDLESIAARNEFPKKVLWIGSRHNNLKQRLRENPFEYPDLLSSYSDFSDASVDVNGKLVVGNIIHLNKILAKNKKLLSDIKSGYGRGGVDLVSGGPPCQSFSMAGLRQKDSDKNRLPWEFATFVDLVRPKIAVLENVTGILRAFREDGHEFYAWFEVAKAFSSIGYVPLCLHVNARLAGVPQNRPRFILIAIRSDFYPNLAKKFNESELSLFGPSYDFFKKVLNKKDVSLKDIQYFDVVNPTHLNLYKNSFLAPFVSGSEVSVKKALGDLKLSHPDKKSTFVTELNKLFGMDSSKGETPNHGPRANNQLVRRRFRIYQVISQCSKSTAKQVTALLKGEADSLGDDAWLELSGHSFISDDGKVVAFKNKKSILKYFLSHQTKKLTQKALVSNLPAPAALSIPDDACHYDENELRTLTVREMARIQSFPDGFVFKSKVTTGGQMRKFEVPQYTQVGNAVPPLLGYAIGRVVAQILQKIS